MAIRIGASAALLLLAFVAGAAADFTGDVRLTPYVLHALRGPSDYSSCVDEHVCCIMSVETPLPPVCRCQPPDILFYNVSQLTYYGELQRHDDLAPARPAGQLFLVPACFHGP